LTDLLQFTGSEYGFIGNVVEDPHDGHRYVRMLVMTDVSWDDDSRERYQRHSRGEEAFEFHDLDTLYGAAVTSGRPVIANHPAHDIRRGGLPAGHRALRAFLGVPLFHGGELIGVVGLSNRPGGYRQAMVEFLEPLFASVAALLGAVRAEEARRATEQ